MDYLYRLTLPFAKKNIGYRELTNKEIITLSKANIMLPQDDEDNIAGYSEVLREIMFKCVKQKEIFNSLNIIDYLFLILKIRIISLGQEAYLELNSDKTEIKNAKITLDLQRIILNIFEITKDLIPEISYKEINVKIDWPSFKDENILRNLKGLQILPLCIKEISFKDKKINYFNLSYEQKQILFDNLPLKLHLILKDKIFQITKKIQNIKLMNIPEVGDLSIDLYNPQSLLRLFFSENLKEIYQQYYLLASKKNISPVYLDQITHGERVLYFSYIEKELELQSQDSINSETSESSLENLMREFGDLSDN